MKLNYITCLYISNIEVTLKTIAWNVLLYPYSIRFPWRLVSIFLWNSSVIFNQTNIFAEVRSQSIIFLKKKVFFFGLWETSHVKCSAFYNLLIWFNCSKCAMLIFDFHLLTYRIMKWRMLFVEWFFVVDKLLYCLRLVYMYFMLVLADIINWK